VQDDETLEREYRILSAKVTYAEVAGQKVEPADEKRLEELAELRVKAVQPDFRDYAAA
jgi:hypothetical protein